MQREKVKTLILSYIVFHLALFANAQRLDVVSFNGSENSGFASSYILTCGRQSIVVDPPMSVNDVKRLADTIKKFNRNIVAIFITDAYPDHFLGISETKKLFPHARVLATHDVALDISRYGMELYDELNIRQVHDVIPRIVLPDSIVENFLSLENCRIELHSFHIKDQITTTVLYDPIGKFLFTSDIVYNKVHPISMDKKPGEWLKELDSLKRFSTYILYPGHGLPTTYSGIDDFKNYINTFQQAAKTRDPIAFYDIMVYYFQDYLKPANLKFYIDRYAGFKHP